MGKITFSYITLLLAMYFADVTSSTKEQEVKLHIKDEYAKIRYDRLLASIVKLNQKRYDTVNKFSRLDGTDVAKVTRMLREGQKSSDEYHKDLNIRVIQPKIIYIKRDDISSPEYFKFMCAIFNTREMETSTKIYLTPRLRTAGNTNMNSNLRSKPSECNTAARRKCTQACISSFKIGCLGYGCSSRIKKAYKNECKRTCKSKFD